MGQEHQAGAVRSRRRQLERDDLPEELIRHLDEDAGAVAGIGIRSAGAAVFEVDEEVEGGADYLVRARALDAGDEADTARIVLISWAVQALRSLVANSVHALIRGPSQS